MMKSKYPIPPKLFFCFKCNVYFFTNSGLDKPTHSRCKCHNTRKATEKEKQEIREANGYVNI